MYIVIISRINVDNTRDKDNHIMTPLEEFFVGVNDLLKDLLKKGYDEYERYKN